MALIGGQGIWKAKLPPIQAAAPALPANSMSRGRLTVQHGCGAGLFIDLRIAILVISRSAGFF